MKRTFFLFHCTGGHPDIYWFPWFKDILTNEGHRIYAPQFPSPPDAPSNLNEWLQAFEPYMDKIDAHSIFVGHSLGGIFALRLLERIAVPIHFTAIAASYVGVGPVNAPATYENEEAFSGFEFDWTKIKSKSERFRLFYSDNDPYIQSSNGELIAQKFETDLTIIPDAGHYNTDSGYDQFPELLEQIKASI